MCGKITNIAVDMSNIDDIFLERYPKIDLHGYDRDSARMATVDFILENIALGNDTVVIIHGIGTGVLREEVHNVLKNNKMVKDYKLDNFNSGCTIAKLNIKKD